MYLAGPFFFFLRFPAITILFRETRPRDIYSCFTCTCYRVLQGVFSVAIVARMKNFKKIKPIRTNPRSGTGADAICAFLNGVLGRNESMPSFKFTCETSSRSSGDVKTTLFISSATEQLKKLWTHSDIILYTFTSTLCNGARRPRNVFFFISLWQINKIAVNR